MTGVFEFRRLPEAEQPYGSLSAYEVSIKGSCGVIGTVAKYRTTSHRYVNSGRIISRTFHPVRWSLATSGSGNQADVRHAYHHSRQEAASSLLRAYNLRKATA